MSGEDLYGMSISEGIEIPIESFADVALSNAQNGVPDAEIVKEEYRVVNGVKVIHLQIKGTFQGIKISYFGYYYSDSSGSTQFLVYTGAGAVEKYKSEIFGFLNGLVTQ